MPREGGRVTYTSCRCVMCGWALQFLSPPVPVPVAPGNEKLEVLEELGRVEPARTVENGNRNRVVEDDAIFGANNWKRNNLCER